MNRIVTVIACLVIVGCQPEPASEAAGAAEADTLAAILDAQPDEAKARYPYRHPKETIEFFGIEPGMTVVEALPGGGWYTKILIYDQNRDHVDEWVDVILGDRQAADYVWGTAVHWYSSTVDWYPEVLEGLHEVARRGVDADAVARFLRMWAPVALASERYAE